MILKENKLKSKLEMLYRKERCSFVIFPYGENGKWVERILKRELGLSPRLIVDNHVCRVISTVISGEEFKQQHSDKDYIILTAADRQLNQELLNEVKSFCNSSHIINLLEIESDTEGYYQLPMFNGFRLNSLLGKKCTDSGKRGTNEIIRVRVLNFSQATWNSICTICSACQSDKDIDLLIIMGEKNTSEKMCDVIDRENYRYVFIDEYDVKEDCPDILVISHPYDFFSKILDCRRYCKLIVVASMQLIRYAHSWKDFLNQQITGFGRFYPDLYIFDSLLYRDMVNAGFVTNNIFEMGNAKFDGIFVGLQNQNYPKSWDKLIGKKVILWTTDHGVNYGRITKEVTLDLYGKVLFELARTTADVGFIFRPHSTLITELLESGLWTKQDLEYLKRYCDLSDNIIFDDSMTYDAAFSIADGIITDAYCGITCSALPLGKPVCLLYRSKEDIPYHKEIEQSTYSARNESEIRIFVEMVANGQHSKAELQRENIAKCIKNFDGNNGKRIKDFLKKIYFKYTEGDIC